MTAEARAKGMDESKVSIDLRARMFLGVPHQRYRVVVRLTEDADPDALRRSGYGPGRLGADSHTVGLDLEADGVIELSQQNWVQSLSVSYQYHPLNT